MARTYIILEAERKREPGTLDTVLVDTDSYDNYEADDDLKPEDYFRPNDYMNVRRVGTVDMESDNYALVSLPTIFEKQT